MARLRSASLQPQQRLTAPNPPGQPSPAAAYPPLSSIEPAPAPQHESEKEDDTTDMQGHSSTICSPVAVRKPSVDSEIELDKSETATPEAACARLIAEKERLGDGPAILDLYRVLWAQHAQPPAYCSSALDLLLDAATTDFLTKQLDAELTCSDRRTRRSMDRLIGFPWSGGREKSSGIHSDISLTRLQLFAIFGNHGRFLEKLAKLAGAVTEQNIGWEAIVFLLRRASDARHDGAPAGVRQTKRNGKTGIGRGISTGAEWATKDVDMVQLVTRKGEKVAGDNGNSAQSVAEPVRPSPKRPMSKHSSMKTQPDLRQDSRKGPHKDSHKDAQQDSRKHSPPDTNGSMGSPPSVEIGRKAVKPLSDFGSGIDSPDSNASLRRSSNFSFSNSPMFLQDFNSPLHDEISSLGFGCGFRDWLGDRPGDRPTSAHSPSRLACSTNSINISTQPQSRPLTARLHSLADAAAHASLTSRPPQSSGVDFALRSTANDARDAPTVSKRDPSLHPDTGDREPDPVPKGGNDPQDDTSLQEEIGLQDDTDLQGNTPQDDTPQDDTAPQDDIVGNFDDEPSAAPDSYTTRKLPSQDTATTVKAAGTGTISKLTTTSADTTLEASVMTAEIRPEKRPFGESSITEKTTAAKKPRFKGPRKAWNVTNREAHESIGHVREIFDLVGFDTTGFAPDAVVPRDGPIVAGFSCARGEDVPKSVFIMPLPVAASEEPFIHGHHWALCEYTVEEGQPFMSVCPYTAAPQLDEDLKENFEGTIASGLKSLFPTNQATGLLFEWDFSSSYNETVTQTILDDAPYYLAAKAIFRARDSSTSLPMVVDAPVWQSVLTRTLSWPTSPHDAWSLDTFKPPPLEEPDDTKSDDKPSDDGSGKEQPLHLQDLETSDKHLRAALSRFDREQNAFKSAAEALGLWWDLLTELVDQTSPAHEDLQALSQKRSNAQKEWEGTNEACFQQSIAFYTKQLRTHSMSQVKASCADMKSNIERRMKRAGGDKAKEISRALDAARRLTDKWQQMVDQHS